jgi:hypothetical protein
MEQKQIKLFNDKLERIESLLILIATKSGAKSEEVGSVLGVSGGQIRNILSGTGQVKKKVSRKSVKRSRKTSS